jgi:hypothetical protein
MKYPPIPCEGKLRKKLAEKDQMCKKKKDKRGKKDKKEME